MTLEEAEGLLGGGGYQIEEKVRLGNDTGWQLKLGTGQVVNVYDKGTHNVQGKNPSFVKVVLASGGSDGRGRKVFVVYGHDEQSLLQLDAMLRRWQLEPLILGQLPSGGQTIIEKLEHYQKDVAFGVVLATPDTKGIHGIDPTRQPIEFGRTSCSSSECCSRALAWEDAALRF